MGSNVALENVSLEVPAGVVFALLGENGAGKTTAIRLMLGLTEPTHGEVRVLGLDSRRDGLAVRRRVGYLSESPALVAGFFSLPGMFANLRVEVPHPT